jgi:hypothetical protein
MTRQSPAEVVILLFGGVRPLAKKLKRSHSAIVRWRTPLCQGGTGGRIPSQAMAELIALAALEGKPLTPHDLIVGRDGG